MVEDATEEVGWTTYAKAAAILLAGIAAGIVLPTAFEGESGSGLLWTSLFMLLLGGLAFWLGFRELRTRQLVVNTPTSKVRSLAVGDVEVKGRARPADETLVSPLTHTDAVAYHLEIREERDGGEGSEWTTVLEIQQDVPFYVDDGTGQVLVEPDDADLRVSIEGSVHVDASDEPPDTVQAWADAEGADVLDPEIPREEGQDTGVSGAMTDAVEGAMQKRARRHLRETRPNDRRYRETVLAAGEETYVFGGAYPREGTTSPRNPENLVIGEHEGTGRFIVSDKPETELASEGIVKIAVLIALAIGLLPAAIFGLRQALGLG